jgi:tetratricopeptide (TPR) repeat protein
MAPRLATAIGCMTTLVVVGCAGAREPPGPVMSPTGMVYPPGTPPTPTARSQTAILYLRQDRVERALELALDGIKDDPGNPVHYFLAGVAYARLEDYVHADSMFTRAQDIFPAYELDIEPQREAAWGQAFNAGLEAYQDGDTERTIDLWRQATLMFDLRPEAHRNLASLLSSEGRYREAIEVYQKALSGLSKRPATRRLTDAEVAQRAEDRFQIEKGLAQLLLLTNRFAEAEPLLRRQLARDSTDVQLRADLAQAIGGQGREDEAAEIYSDLLSEGDLATAQLFNLGVGLFRASDYTQAAEAFRRLTEIQPNSRDAWFNYANALFAGQDWEGLVAAGQRLIDLDPLGENSRLITARAQLETGDRPAALASVAHADEAPVYLDELQLRAAARTTTVTGRVIGNAAQPGDAVGLRFFFYGDADVLLGSETLTVTAPEKEERAALEVSFSQRASAYRYELIH